MNVFATGVTKVIATLIILFCLSDTDVSLAEKIDLTTKLSVRGEYSDNISFERGTNAREDYSSRIEPSITAAYATEKATILTNALFHIVRYADETEEDRENQQYKLIGACNLSERIGFKGDFRYKKDTTQETELIETGEVTRRQDSERYIGNSLLFWQLSELSTISLQYAFLKKDFESSESDRHSTQLSYANKFNNGLDIATLSMGYTYRDSKSNKENEEPVVNNKDSNSKELDKYSLSIDWQHKFSELYKFSVSLGGRYSEEEFVDGNQEDSWGGVVNLNLVKKGENSNTTLGYSRNLYTDVSGGETEVDKIHCNYNRRLIRRLWVRLKGNIYFRREPSGSSSKDETFYRINPSLNYKITENHNLIIGYSYSREKDDSLLKNSTVDQNKVWFAFIFRLKKIW